VGDVSRKPRKWFTNLRRCASVVALVGAFRRVSSIDQSSRVGTDRVPSREDLREVRHGESGNVPQ
jgi:hypothetical protein